MKKNYLIITLFIISFNLTFSQNERISALGNTTIALRDFDLDLNLYDFGKNVAFLFEDQKFDVLKIRPGISSTKGDYRRFFDYESSSIYSLNFDGIKILKDGVFRGYVVYEVELRKNVNRSLKRYPYTGIPFFIADTTVGNFLYNGPKVGFQYSFEFMKNLLMGIELNYQIVNGLKDVYSRAKSLYRNIDGNLSLAYKLSDAFSIGGKISQLDNKESIEAKSEDLFDAEIFNYRGDTYSFRRRSQSIDQTYREKATAYSIQTTFTPINDLNIGLKSDYSLSNLKTQYPYGMLKEYEEGHSVFENLSFAIKAHYLPFNNLQIGFESEYEDNNSWSRISELALMIWKWNLKNFKIGSGYSYRFKNLPLISVSEFVIGKIISDSSKYIDNKYVSHNRTYYLIKTGLEFEISKQIFLRGGYQRGKFGFDPVRGGKNVELNKISGGVGLYSFKSFELDFVIEYTFQKNEIGNSNKYINSQMNLRLFNY